MLESNWLKDRNRDDFDRYGDSYTGVLTTEDFLNQMNYMALVGTESALAPEDKDELLEELGVPQRPYQGLRFAVCGYSASETHYLQSLISFMGGEIEQKCVNFIVADKSDNQEVRTAVKSSRGARVVDLKWVERAAGSEYLAGR